MKRKENRIVIIREGKKILENWKVEITEEIQDGGKTLKLFLKTKKGI